MKKLITDTQGNKAHRQLASSSCVSDLFSCEEKKMNAETTKAMSDKFRDVSTMKNIGRKMADAMFAVHGFYTYVESETGLKVFVTKGI